MRFHHLGIPTQSPRRDEVYLAEFGVHVTSHKKNPFGIQWMRYEPGFPLPEMVKNMPHLAFPVEFLEFDGDHPDRLPEDMDEEGTSHG